MDPDPLKLCMSFVQVAMPLASGLTDRQRAALKNCQTLYEAYNIVGDLLPDADAFEPLPRETAAEQVCLAIGWAQHGEATRTRIHLRRALSHLRRCGSRPNDAILFDGIAEFIGGAE